MEKVLNPLDSKHRCVFCGSKMTEMQDSCGVDYKCYCADELKRLEIQSKLRSLEEKFSVKYLMKWKEKLY
jgi:hypothetical protein